MSFEFFGPYLGPTAVVFGLPLLCYALALLVSSTTPTELSSLPLESEIWSISAFFNVAGYLCLILGLHLLLPAKQVEGIKLPDDKRLTYRLNGIYVFLLVYGITFYTGFVSDHVDLEYLHNEWIPHLIASVAVSFVLSACLYLGSFREKTLLAKGGQTGYRWYDFFIGRELNPRIGQVDLKEFCELYPGLIGWTLLNLANAHKQSKTYGSVTNSMIMVNIFHFVYVFDALVHEPSILSTMDITSDGFGFMLAFGDLTWVPFIYSLQSKYLAHNPTELSVGFASLILVIHTMGYLIFRGSNSQKDRFRRNPEHPSVRKLKTLKTSSGKKLIISGWWGMARHINYTGDWLMGLAWCMTCGFASPIPYFYAIYFGILLIHRDLRDEAACKEKYGADWNIYCSLVPYRFIPYVY